MTRRTLCRTPHLPAHLPWLALPIAHFVHRAHNRALVLKLSACATVCHERANALRNRAPPSPFTIACVIALVPPNTPQIAAPHSHLITASLFAPRVSGCPSCPHNRAPALKLSACATVWHDRANAFRSRASPFPFTPAFVFAFELSDHLRHSPDNPLMRSACAAWWQEESNTSCNPSHCLSTPQTSFASFV